MKKVVTWSSEVVTPKIRRPCECMCCKGCGNNHSRECLIFCSIICGSCEERRCEVCFNTESNKCRNCLRDW